MATVVGNANVRGLIESLEFYKPLFLARCYNGQRAHLLSQIHTSEDIFIFTNSIRACTSHVKGYTDSFITIEQELKPAGISHHFFINS